MGCVDEVGKDMENAVVEAPAAEAAAPADAADKSDGTVWYGSDGLSIEALGAKVTATHPINFAQMSAQATTNADGQLSAIEYSIDMSDFTSDHPKLTEHLHNEDFFHTGMFPAASFKSTSVSAMPADADGNNAKIQGALTIRGVTKTIEAMAKAGVEGDVMRATSKFKIN
jgi:polyisoprenoid-binding protein YceI